MKQMIQMTACAPGDEDGHRAALALTAYFNAEDARALRQRLWPRLAFAAVIACVVEATTSLLTRSGFLVSLVGLVVAAVAAAVAKWDAEGTLREVMASQGASMEPSTRRPDSRDASDDH